MLDAKETQAALDRFITSVVSQSKRNLTLQSKNATKKLHKSIKGSSKVSENSISASIQMEDYGKYQDRGVKGVGGTKADGSAWNLQPVTRNGLGLNRPYSFKKGLENKPSRKHFDKWTVVKGIAPRLNGKFTNRTGLTSAISHAVWHQGIKTSNFFSRPFEAAFKRLPDELVEAYGLDVEDFIEFVIKE